MVVVQANEQGDHGQLSRSAVESGYGLLVKFRGSRRKIQAGAVKGAGHQLQMLNTPVRLRPVCAAIFVVGLARFAQPDHLYTSFMRRFARQRSHDALHELTIPRETARRPIRLVTHDEKKEEKSPSPKAAARKKA